MEAAKDHRMTLDRYRLGSELLRDAVAGLTNSELDWQPSQGGWTIREIIHHIVDGDYIWTLGLKQALGPEGSEFRLDWYQKQSQDKWTEDWAYSQRPIDLSLAMLGAIRAHVLQLLEHIPDAWERSISVRTSEEKLETVSIACIVKMNADHVEHHLKRIMTIRNEII